jgi:xylulose-5-phosphate/fructose-6-phosphate phosphoketolase
VPRLQVAGAHVKSRLRDLQIECRLHAHEHGVDHPEHIDWAWPAAAPVSSSGQT